MEARTVTRTQLQEMSDRDLVEHARRWAAPGAHAVINIKTVSDLTTVVAELANRLDDRYPFNPNPEPETETAS